VPKLVTRPMRHASFPATAADRFIEIGHAVACTVFNVAARTNRPRPKDECLGFVRPQVSAKNELRARSKNKPAIMSSPLVFVERWRVDPNARRVRLVDVARPYPQGLAGPSAAV
jgi:hypothetical protein